MQRLLVPVAVVMHLAGIAHAQDAAESKSSTVAVSLSVGLTAAGAGALFIPNDGARLAGIGLLFFGPSTGRWYAGEVGLSGVGYRLSALSLLLAYAAVTSESDGDLCSDPGPCDSDPPPAGIALIAASASVWLAASIADVVLAHRAVRRYNAAHALTIAPTPMGESGQGLVLTGRF